MVSFLVYCYCCTSRRKVANLSDNTSVSSTSSSHHNQLDISLRNDDSKEFIGDRNNGKDDSGVEMHVRMPQNGMLRGMKMSIHKALTTKSSSLSTTQSSSFSSSQFGRHTALPPSEFLDERGTTQLPLNQLDVENIVSSPFHSTR
jgi:hypothetical protein